MTRTIAYIGNKSIGVRDSGWTYASMILVVLRVYGPLTVGCDISRTVDLLPVPAESQLQLEEAARLRPLPNCQCDLARLRPISPSQVTHANSRLQRRRLITGRIHIAVLRYQCIGAVHEFVSLGTCPTSQATSTLPSRLHRPIQLNSCSDKSRFFGVIEVVIIYPYLIYCNCLPLILPSSSNDHID